MLRWCCCFRARGERGQQRDGGLPELVVGWDFTGREGFHDGRWEEKKGGAVDGFWSLQWLVMDGEVRVIWERRRWSHRSAAIGDRGERSEEGGRRLGFVGMGEGDGHDGCWSAGGLVGERFRDERRAGFSGGLVVCLGKEMRGRSGVMFVQALMELRLWCSPANNGRK
ncbi:hypothetical protein HAX54_025053 [Datura stramonium]|uniref:Uncharacterized protein n=1 Tax=Datura stramonium TaxID=4076 RepID=A0ABS8V033_DATST|nr:hypothetical protein [Datura stramonium]